MDIKKKLEEIARRTKEKGSSKAMGRKVGDMMEDAGDMAGDVANDVGRAISDAVPSGGSFIDEAAGEIGDELDDAMYSGKKMVREGVKDVKRSDVVRGGEDLLEAVDESGIVDSLAAKGEEILVRLKEKESDITPEVKKSVMEAMDKLGGLLGIGEK